MTTLTTDEMLERLAKAQLFNWLCCHVWIWAARSNRLFREFNGTTPHKAVSALYNEALRLGLVEPDGIEPDGSGILQEIKS